MVRIGIIGAGLMGRQHARSLAGSDRAEFVAVCGLEEGPVRELAETHGVDWTTSVDELLDRDDLDGVMVATPTDTHVSVARQVIESGRDVFSEKPLARHFDEAEDLISAAAEQGRIVQVGHVIRYFPEYQLLRDKIRSGELGTLATATFGRRCATPDWTQDGWLADYARGGGAMLDMMIHDIDLVRWYFGEPDSAFARAVGPERWDGVDYALATLTVPGGPLCHLHASWAEPEGFSQSAEICGSAGMLQYDSREPFDVRRARHGSAGDPVTALPEPEGEDPFQLQIHDFVEAIETRQPPPRDGEWALASLRVALALLESAETGMAIQLDGWRPGRREAVTA